MWGWYQLPWCRWAHLSFFSRLPRPSSSGYRSGPQPRGWLAGESLWLEVGVSQRTKILKTKGNHFMFLGQAWPWTTLTYLVQHWLKQGFKLAFGFATMSSSSHVSVDLTGCATEWEDSKELRKLVRQTGSLFSPLPTKLVVEPSVDAAALNHTALLPVAKRLHVPDSDGIGMVSIPKIEEQLLVILWSAVVTEFHIDHIDP